MFILHNSLAFFKDKPRKSILKYQFFSILYNLDTLNQYKKHNYTQFYTGLPLKS